MVNLVGLRWLRRYHRLVLWIVSISLIPTITLLGFSYYQAISTARSELKKATEQSSRKLSELIRAADLTLRELEIYLENFEGTEQAAWQLLQQIAYNDPRFREVGIVDEQGYLVATSLGPVEPPIAIKSKTRADLSRREIQIVGPVTTSVMQQRSLVLALPTQGQGELNVLIDPTLLQDFWTALGEQDLGQEGFLVYVDQHHEKIIAGVGLVPRRAETLLAPASRDRIQVRYPVDETDIVIVGEISKGWALRHWERLLITVAPVVLGTSLLVFAALTRFTYFTQLLDYDIRIGLKNREFELYYQPIFDLVANTCIGAEVLIRWKHSYQGLILPGVFIPIAEKTGLIVEMGDWVLQKAAVGCSELLADYPNLYISINLSPVQITSYQNAQAFYEKLKEHEAVTPHLMFEITETSLAETGQEAIPKTLKRIHSLGAKIALDDFGTGFCGINYLSQFSFDYLKIDRTFTCACETTSNLSTALDGMIDLAKRFEANLIAEGIETEKQRQTLLDKGIQFGQGWLYAHPMSLAEFKQFLSLQAGIAKDVGFPSSKVQ
ncbi:MAG: EAL domain-containing protein [Leptolyngbya sp. SIOISBB]|nr:EAL domain-containing protein [Leptolyngbya sp. SIOISBB]